MTARRILLADADAFFVAVARMVDPDGAGKEPLLIVGGTRESRGVVCSASYEARKFGVRSAMPISRALRLCPQGDVRSRAAPRVRREEPGDPRGARALFAPVVEGASIDEWYMDLAGTEALYDARAARRHRGADSRRRHRATRRCRCRSAAARPSSSPSSPSNAPSRSRAPAPPASTSSTPGDEAPFLETFDLADIPMIGPRFQERLAKLGMRRVPDVLQYDVADAHPVARRARGRVALRSRARHRRTARSRRTATRRASAATRRSRSTSTTTTISAASCSRSSRARRPTFAPTALTARTITVRIRDYDFKTRQASRTLDAPVISDRVILEVAHALLAKLRAARRVPARLLGVGLSSLGRRRDGRSAHAVREARLARPTRPIAIALLARTVDRVRAKFGDRGILPAGLID